MFINSKIKLAVTLPDGSVHRIPRGYIGDLPEAVAGSWIVQAAIKSGDIAVPGGSSDKALEKADAEAEALKIVAEEVAREAKEADEAAAEEETQAEAEKPKAKKKK